MAMASLPADAEGDAWADADSVALLQQLVCQCLALAVTVLTAEMFFNV